MAKKWMAFGMALVMLLGVFGMSGCGARSRSLEEYKIEQKEAIEVYGNSKGQENYSENGWAAVCKAVNDGKTGVGAAADKPAVGAEVKSAKEAIDRVITFAGIPLGDALRLEILSVYHSWEVSKSGQDEDFDSTRHFVYYGQYSGFYVLGFFGWYFSYHKEYIGGLEFSRPGSGNFYAVRKDKIGGTLREIYKSGHLTREELEEIHGIHTFLNFRCYLTV